MKKVSLNANGLIFILLTIGCSTTTEESAMMLGEFQVLKKIEQRVLSVGTVVTNEVPDVCQGKISDYFGIIEALEAYNKGRTIIREAVSSQAVASLPVYSETNIVKQAFRDGIDDGTVKDIDVLRCRDQSRRRLQEMFWGLGGASVKVKLEACATTDSGVATNFYSELAASYKSGYKNGWSVVWRLKRSPIATGYYCSETYLGSDAMKRVYVYGWYSACYDYFVLHGDEDCVDQSGCVVQAIPSPVFFYRGEIENFKARELRFLHFCARQQ